MDTDLQDTLAAIFALAAGSTSGDTRARRRRGGSSEFAEPDASTPFTRTVAAPQDIQTALEALNTPAVLPEKGMGAREAVGRVMRELLPGLAGGQAGPR